MTRVADTSFLYAAFDEDDPRHDDALDEIAKPERFGVPLSTLAEFLDLVTYRHGHNVARKMHDDLVGLGTISIIEIRSPEDALKLWESNDKLSVVDAVGVQACRETGASLLSYDERQRKAHAEP